jgi:outer membrane lipoprotein-sorting protein
MVPLFRCRLLFAFAVAGLAGADLAATPGTLLNDPAHDPAWTALFSKLSASKTRLSHFEERRYFPFRSKPVVLKGVIRIIPGRGLSLNYLEPDRRILIVDDKGVLLRDEEGGERSVSSDPRTKAVTSSLVSVLRFDVAELQQSFVIYGRHDGGAWTLGFVPRDPAVADLVGTLFVSGEKLQLNRIEMTKSATQRIEILISDAQEDVIFPGDVIERYFR